MSQQEIEIKIKLLPEQVTSLTRWLALHADLVDTRDQLDIYFDTTNASDSFFRADNTGIITADRSIRIRQSADTYLLCAKEKSLSPARSNSHSGFKCSKEYEVVIEHGQPMAEILCLLGYTEKIRVSKTRTTYQYQHTTICLDQVKDLGTFLEVEVLVDSDQEPYKAQKQIHQTLAAMGITSGTVYSYGYALLLLNKQKELGVTLSW